MSILHESPTPNLAQHYLTKLAGAFKTAMVVTHANDGSIRARPMDVAELEPSGRLWFVTGEESSKAEELRVDPRANVVMQSSSHYISISGTATLLVDAEKARELWTEAWRPWFPGGPEDRELALLRFDPVRAETWDLSGLSGARYALQALRHALHGDRMSDEPNMESYHRQIEFPL